MRVSRFVLEAYATTGIHRANAVLALKCGQISCNVAIRAVWTTVLVAVRSTLSGFAQFRTLRTATHADTDRVWLQILTTSLKQERSLICIESVCHTACAHSWLILSCN